MKKSLLVASLLAVVALAACNKSNDQAAAPTGDTPAPSMPAATSDTTSPMDATSATAASEAPAAADMHASDASASSAPAGAN